MRAPGFTGVRKASAARKPGPYAWLAFGLLAYLAFAVSSLPAAAVYRFFAPQELRLLGVDGTLWSGGAALGSASGFPLHDIHWHIDASALLTGRLAGRVQARLSDGFVDTRFSARPIGADLTALQASTSLPALAALLPIKGIQGLVSLALGEVRFENGRLVAAVGQVRLSQLAVPTLMPAGGRSEPVELGNYEIVFKDTGGRGIAAEFHDTGGPLQVSGTLSLDPKQRYEIKGLLAPRANAPKELVQGLELVTGSPDAKGQRAFSLTGSL
ncbi:MAG TPA: type II secretion system protein N [Gammaproteobacteria bacterium]|nr:type II secretion system protein N [Gammaproteobacteria bacterium]